ncbi:MAG: divalent metal cation transporter [Desulfitobacterium hafniense]|nr:divalent metal cation transporter [Desulfitobacterium hafniense]
MFGIPQWVSVPFAALLLIFVTRGRYSLVERIAILFGLFELCFLPAAFLAHPDPTAIMNTLYGSQPINNKSYLMLIAANVGAVIVPWMIFYQQGAVVDKGLKPYSLKYCRIDTFFGSIVTQVVMAAVLVLAAATIGRAHPNTSLENVQQIASALTPLVGTLGGKVLFSFGVTGAALIAAIVVSLATSWAFGEVMGFRCSLNYTWREAPAFYGIYAAGIVIAASLVLIGIPLVSLTIAVEVMNALLLPIVLGFLLALGWKALPKKYRLLTWEKVILLFIYVIICSLGIFTLFQL